MSEYEDFAEYMVEWDKTLNRKAVRELISRHRDEFDELSGQAAQDRINSLERVVTESLREIEALRAANPDGVAVPALTETANALVARNTELDEASKRLQRSIAKLKSDNKKLREMLADA